MNRAGYIAARIVQIVPTFILIGLVVFVLARLLPGDPVSAMLGDRATDEAVNRLRSQMGLDRSIWTQFVFFLENVMKGDFGTSIAYRVPVTRLIAERLPVTLTLTVFATLFALILAVPLAFVAAINANKWPDYVIRAVFQVGLSSPIFYVGLVLLTVLAAWLRIFPVGGYGDTVLDHLWHLFLPVHHAGAVVLRRSSCATCGPPSWRCSTRSSSSSRAPRGSAGASCCRGTSCATRSSPR